MYFNCSMKKELDLVARFHKKFGSQILNSPSLITKERITLRHKLMKEEVQEYLAGCQNDDLENIAKELADILYATYGTILEHGLQNKIEEIFMEVHLSNMSKDVGLDKPTKGKKFLKPDIRRILNK